MKFRPIVDKLRSISREQVLLTIPLLLYVVFEALFVLPLPLVGVHSWNESTYLSMANYLQKGRQPFVFKAAYDPLRPDYNVGYLFFWASYAFHYVARGLFTISPDVFLLLSRLFSLIATLASCLLIYNIAIKLSKQFYCAYASVITFLFSPLVLYFGARFQLEPFTFFVFLLAWKLIIRYTETGKFKNALLGFIILGALIATRQIFAIYVPALLLTSLVNDTKRPEKCNKARVISSILVLMIGFVCPLAITQLMVPEYAPFKFQFFRLMESPGMALSSPGTGNFVILYLQNSLFPSLGLVFLFVPLFIAVLLRERKSHIEAVAFLLGAFTYFVFAFLHNIVHMYHSYYFLPVIILATIFVTSFALRNKRKRLAIGLLIFLVGSCVFSVWETVSFYGVGSNRIYRDIDPFGNLDSVFAGYLINRLYQLIKDRGLLCENLTYYSLVQSPAVYFYEEMPTISYYDFFIWNATSKAYDGFNFFSDQETFLQALRRQNLFILTITPDVYEYQNQPFQKYLQENFAFVASEGVYTFYLNQTIFDQDPIFCKNKTFRTLMELENSGIAPNSCSRAVTNMSEWYSVSKNSRVLGHVILNQYPQTFYLESREANNRSLTFEISMITKHFSQMETIVSFDDIVNVKYGNSDDVYLELISTADGYRWISGADISKYFWQNLTLTFVYDIDAFRAEIYFNGVLVSSTLRGVNGCSFSPIRLPTSHSIRTCVCSNITELYSIKLWNRALSCDEIRTTGSSDSGSIDRTRDSLKYVLFRI